MSILMKYLTKDNLSLSLFFKIQYYFIIFIVRNDKFMNDIIVLVNLAMIIKFCQFKQTNKDGEIFRAFKL